MKKLKVILILTMLLIFIIIGSSLKSLSSLKKIGYSLVEIGAITDWKSNENSSVEGIVNIGDGLYSILKNHQVPYEQIKVDSQIGDCFGYPPNFFDLITHSIQIISPKDTLCIRLKYDPFRSKYHIVGYSGTIK